MSPKTKLGRNPFDKATNPALPKRPAKTSKRASTTAGAGAAKSAGNARAKKPRSKPHQERVFRRVKGEGFLHLVHDLTHYWLPRIKACATMRALRTFSKFA